MFIAAGSDFSGGKVKRKLVRFAALKQGMTRAQQKAALFAPKLKTPRPSKRGSYIKKNFSVAKVPLVSLKLEYHHFLKMPFR